MLDKDCEGCILFTVSCRPGLTDDGVLSSLGDHSGLYFRSNTTASVLTNQDF